MEKLLTQLKEHFKQLGLNPDLVEVVISQRPDLADYQLNTALTCQKILKQNPMTLATDVVNQIKNDDFELSVAKPGFINIKLKSNKVILDIPKVNKTNHPKKVLIDFSSPNVAKGMHVGHLRSTLIGSSLTKIFKFLGHNVISDNHIGDWGTPLGIVITKISEVPNYVYSLESIEQLYIEGSIQYKDETNIEFKNKVQKITEKLQTHDSDVQAIWKKIIDCTLKSLKADYLELGIEFDEYLGESFYEPLIKPMIKDFEAKQLTALSNGALVANIGDENPLILEKTNGGYLYQTTDLACLKYRQEKYDQALYVVDKRQKLHFEQVFKAAKLVGYLNKLNPEHVAFGTVNGTDGKPYKTRSGNVLKLKELIEEAKKVALNKLQELNVDYSDEEQSAIAHTVAIGALKFAELKHNRLSDYSFDLEAFMALEGYTGPYVMYAGVRIKSILNKAQNFTVKPEAEHLISAEEKSLILSLHKFPVILEKVAKNYEPHHLCELAYEIAKNFSSFYQKHQVLNESNTDLKSHYLWVLTQTLETLNQILNLLGINIPEKM